MFIIGNVMPSRFRQFLACVTVNFIVSQKTWVRYILRKTCQLRVAVVRRRLRGDRFNRQSTNIVKLSLVKVGVSEVLRGQPEHDAPVWADNVLAVLAVSAQIFKIAAAAYRLHERIQHHHGL